MMFYLIIASGRGNLFYIPLCCYLFLLNHLSIKKKSSAIYTHTEDPINLYRKID